MDQLVFGGENQGQQDVRGQMKEKISHPVPVCGDGTAKQAKRLPVIDSKKILDQGVELVGELVGRCAGAKGQQHLLDVAPPAEHQRGKVQYGNGAVAQHPDQEGGRLGVPDGQQEAHRHPFQQSDGHPDGKEFPVGEPAGKESDTDVAQIVGEY